MPIFTPRTPLEPVRLLTPAKYKLSVKVPWSDAPRLSSEPVGMLTSNELDVVLRRPVGDDAAAVELLTPPEVIGFFKGTRGGRPESIDKLLTLYPKSTYARHALGRLALDRARNVWQSSSHGAQEPTAALADCLTFVKQFPEHPLSSDILLYAARIQYMFGQRDKRIETLERLMKEYQQSAAAATATRQLRGWRRGRANPISPDEEAIARRRGNGGMPMTRPARESGWIELPIPPATQPATQP